MLISDWSSYVCSSDLSAQEYASRFLGDGSAMSGTIETDADLDPDEEKELWENWKLAHAGPSKEGSEGNLKAGASYKRSTEGREGKECVSTGRCGWWP